jgi:hypothetical protein
VVGASLSSDGHDRRRTSTGPHGRTRSLASRSGGHAVRYSTAPAQAAASVAILPGQARRVPETWAARQQRERGSRPPGQARWSQPALPMTGALLDGARPVVRFVNTRPVEIVNANWLHVRVSVNADRLQARRDVASAKVVSISRRSRLARRGGPTIDHTYRSLTHRAAHRCLAVGRMGVRALPVPVVLRRRRRLHHQRLPRCRSRRRLGPSRRDRSDDRMN